MTEISYFQKYTKRENHVTNNTLLMFRHLYENRPALFEKFLNSLIEDEQSSLELGPRFVQQTKAHVSIPDAHIYQSPLNIFVEAKHHGPLNVDQIKNHLSEAKGHNGAIILVITKQEITNEFRDEMSRICATEKVNFVDTTFTAIVDGLCTIVPNFDVALFEVVQDYKSFIESEGLYFNPFELVVFPCGHSVVVNLEHKVYYHPTRRKSCGNIPFLGFYSNKKISHIGRIKSTVHLDIKRGYDSAKPEFGKMPEDVSTRLEKIVDDAKQVNHYLDNEPHRYYFLDDTFEVNIFNQTKHGLQSRRYFDLRDFSVSELSDKMSTQAIAELVKDGYFGLKGE